MFLWKYMCLDEQSILPIYIWSPQLIIEVTRCFFTCNFTSFFFDCRKKEGERLWLTAEVDMQVGVLMDSFEITPPLQGDFANLDDSNFLIDSGAKHYISHTVLCPFIPLLILELCRANAGRKVRWLHVSTMRLWVVLVCGN